MKIIFITLLGLTLCSCLTEDKNCPDIFWIPAFAYPIKKVYEVGDTITITSKFHRKVMGWTYRGEERDIFDLGHIGFGVNSFIYNIEVDTFLGDAIFEGVFDLVENPNYNYRVFHYSGGTSGLIGEFNFLNDTFDLKYQFFALEPGVYFHSINSDVGLIGGQKVKEMNCSFIGDVFFDFNPGMDSNVELLLESPSSYFNSYLLQPSATLPYTRFEQAGGYAFKVVP